MKTNTNETPGNYLRRTLKDKDAMLEVARLATEDQREAMTHNTREVEQWYKNLPEEPAPGDEVLRVTVQEVTEFLHHQLQKAREEAVKEFASNLRVLIERGNAETAMNIIRDHSELDQPINSIFKE